LVKVVLIHRTKDLESSKALVKLIKQVRSVASKQPGFVYGETLVNTEDPCHIIVISTWKTQEDWEAWDKSAERAATTAAIQALLTQPFNTFIHPEPALWRADIVNTFSY
jgi:heme oxygenase (mycobilin-producing)